MVKIKVTFYGAAHEVGRSAILLEHKNDNLLLDCGIKLGEQIEYPSIPTSKLDEIKHIFITHAHLDHSGYLPHIFAQGYSPNVYATKPTRDLFSVLLPDYARLSGQKFFSYKDVNTILEKINIVEDKLSVPFDCSLHNAGHILGSAMIRVNHNGGILYTGDICMRKTRVLDVCERNLSAKTLIVESTYGNKSGIIPSFKDSYNTMVQLINQTISEGGFVLIPCFAVGRAQEILLTLDDYIRSGALQKTKIYVEGMINKAMKVYRHNAIYANDDIKKRILMSEEDPFKSKFFYRSTSRNRQDVLSEPCIIVSTSGMLSGGPVLFYLEKLASDPKNTIIFVGYQAENTLGYKIVNGEKEIILNEKKIPINLKVVQLRISGHADYNELLQFIRGITNLEKVFLVHGEKTDLKNTLEKNYEVVCPMLNESFELG